MNHDSYEPAYIADILNTVKTVAMVGASANDVRPSWFVLKYLLDKGFSVFPINPGHAGKTIHGAPVVATLADVEPAAEIVDIFRNSADAGAAVDDAIVHGAKAVWMQLGVIDEAAARRAEKAGLAVVMDRCPKIEIPRLGLLR